MDLSPSVAAILKRDNIHYKLVEERDNETLCGESGNFARDPAAIAKIVILTGEDRNIQVYLPANTLLDLSALSSAHDVEYHALSPEALQDLIRRNGFETLPALPQATGFNTVVDEKLLRLPVVYVPAGTPKLLLQLEQAEFKRLLQGADDLAITIPLGRIGMSTGDPEQDLKEINAAVNNHTSRKIQERIEQTLEIPPMPPSAQKISRLCAADDPDVDELIDVVQSDPALAAKVVSHAASPFFAAPGSIKSVQDAIVRVLGFERVMNIALALSMGDILRVPNDAPKTALPYWEQSIFCATIMDRLARKMPKETQPEAGLAYLAGLLHNFGTLILAHVFPSGFSMTCRYIEASPHISHAYIERHLISVTREQLAASLMRSWKLPEEVVTGLRNQENPSYSGTNHVYANLIYLANQLIRQWHSGGEQGSDVPAQLYERLGIKPELAHSVAGEVFAGEEELRAIASGFH